MNIINNKPEKIALFVLMLATILTVCDAVSAHAFDWEAHSGTKIKLLLNKHPYTD